MEVILSTDQPTGFGWIAGLTFLRPTARAVAGTASSPSCLLTLTGGMSQSNPVGSVTTEDCTVAVAGNFNVRGTLVADEITAGSCSNGCADVQIGPPPTDPLAGVQTPTAADCNSGAPGTNVSVGGSVTLSPGTYHNITFTNTFGSSDWLTLSSGTYCLTGLLSPTSPGVGLRIDATSGVLFYVAPAGEFRADSNSIDLRFSAPTSGAWTGIAFFQDRANAHDVIFGKNTGDVDTNGAIYIPAATLRAKNANFASSQLCGILVTAAIDWDKPNLDMTNACGSFSGSPLTSVALAE